MQNIRITCLQGTFLMTQAVAHLMIKKGITDGSVVNFSSAVVKHGNMGQCNYAASKAGVEAFTKTAAKELAQLSFNAHSSYTFHIIIHVALVSLAYVCLENSK